MGAALAKSAMMKFCLEMNSWGFIHFLFESKLFNVEIAVKIGKNRFTTIIMHKTKLVRSVYKIRRVQSLRE